MNQTPKIFSVSELNHFVQKTLEEKFSDIWVEGEISNYRGASGSGHCYFCLKDANAQVDIVAFRGVMNALRFKLEEGLKVLICGKVTLYPQRGRFQIVANTIEPKGAGALQLAFEQLKKKLEAEGLFSSDRKKLIPALPQKIGIVTSPTGAAIKDILTVIDRRFANVEILIYPVKVQGEGAKEEIAEAIRYLNENHSNLDVLLVGRGGGSIEDLWAFNEEIVARAIAASKIPVISCVGHEIDFTIADFVADLRAPTPSAAAELVVKNKAELLTTLNANYSRLQQNMQSALNFISEQLKGISRCAVFARPQEIFEEKMQMTDDFFDRLNRALQDQMADQKNQLALLQSKIALLSPESLLEERRKFIKSQMERLLNIANQKIQQCRDALRISAGQLEALSPLAVLSRGYAIAWSLPDNQLLKSAAQVSRNDLIRVKLQQGEIKAMVEETTVEVKKDLLSTVKKENQR